MVSFLITILLLPFMPIWLWDNFSQYAQNGPPAKQVTLESQSVLGEEKEASILLDEKSRNSNYFFPMDVTQAAEYTPQRKKGFYEIKIWAGSSVAIDVKSGTILHWDNGKERTQIASLTKLMTAILAVREIKNLEEETVVITKEAIYLPGTTVGCPTSDVCSSNTFYPGEEVYAIDLLKATLMNSANDAAYSLALHIAGSEEKFVEMMNDEAKKMGLKDTNFCTASGLEIDGREEDCYSTAYDIARIGAESLEHDIIWDIMQIEEDRFYSVSGNFMHELKNTDKLIREDDLCIGGKTGFTPLAGKSLLAAYWDPSVKHQVVIVLLDDQERWEHMRILKNWIFNNYEWK